MSLHSSTPTFTASPSVKDASPPISSSSTEQVDLAADLDIEKNSHPPQADAAPSVGPPGLAADDPENPRNWSVKYKAYITFVLVTWVLTVTYSSTAYVASVPMLQRAYNASQTAVILGVSLLVLGFAAGPLIFGPASEMFGRRIVYASTGVFYTAFAIGAAFAPNLATMLVFRFFMGFFGSSALNNVPASVGDYTTPATRGPFSLPYALFAFGGPALGPLCSAFIEADAGLRWNFRVMAIFVGIFSILVAFLPETHGPTLYKWKVAREGRAPPKLTTAQIVGNFKVALSRPIIYLFTEPTVTFVSIYLGVLYAILYGFFQAFVVVWIEIRGFKSTTYGLTYISLGLGFMVGCVLLATVGQKSYMKATALAKANGTKVQPEARLTLAYGAGIVAPLSLLLFAWTAPYPNVHWVVPCLGEFFFGASMLCLFTAFIPYLIDVYLQSAASALAAGTAFRACLASAFPLFALQMYHKLGVGPATSLLAGLCFLLAPLPFVFKKTGERLRQRSRYAVVE